MSLDDYKAAITLTGSRMATFEALIMAAIRRDGSRGNDALRVAFPEVYAEFSYRYWCSGGIMPGEPGYVEELDDNLPVTS